MNLFLIFLILFFIKVKADDKIANINDYFIKNKIDYGRTVFEVKENLSENDFGKANIIGDNRFNILNLSQLTSDVISIEDDSVYDGNKKLFKFKNFYYVIGRKMKLDNVYITCNINNVNTQGGFDAFNIDYIKIEENETCIRGMWIEMYPFTKVENSATHNNYYYWIKDFNTNSNQQLLYELNFISINDNLNDKLVHRVLIPRAFNNIGKIYQDSPSKISIEFDTRQKVVIFGNKNSQKTQYIWLEKDNAYLIVEKNDYYFYIYTDEIIDYDYFSKIAIKQNVSIYIYSGDRTTFRHRFLKI